MSCQSLFSGKNKKNIINLASAESTRRVVKVKSYCFTVTLIQQYLDTSIGHEKDLFKYQDKYGRN